MKARNTKITDTPLALILAASLLPQALHAGFSAPGQGLTNVLSGSVPNGALSWQTTTNWINGTVPAKPYVLETGYTLPVCDAIPVARLVMTVWGGTANYVSQMTVAINGTNLPTANPLVFGSTADTNAIFSTTNANAYGAGSGLWLITLPVPAEMLFKNGTSNCVSVTQTTPDSFDGRIHHVTLVAIYQSGALTNVFDYALAEGSGDIYRAPTSVQTNQRNFTLTVNPANVTAATFTALYTCADTGQNDRLYFNSAQLGSDDVATWDKVGTGLDFGPSIVSFDVLTNLLATNAVKFTVATGDGVPDTRESSLRPQLSVLAVTRGVAATAPTLSVSIQTNQVQLTIAGEAGRTYTVLSSATLTNWTEVGSFVSTNALSLWSIPATNQYRFFRVRTP